MDDNPAPNPFEVPETMDPRRKHDSGQRLDPAMQPNFDSMVTVAKGLWSDYTRTLFASWGTYVAVLLLTSLISLVGTLTLANGPASQQAIPKNLPSSGADPTAIPGHFIGSAFWVYMGVMLVVGVVQVGVAVASLGPVRRAWMEKRNLSMGETIGLIGRRTVPGGLIYVIVLIVSAIGGVMCCIPGMIAGYFMLPSLYLVGARGEGIFDSLSIGFGWAKRHVAMLLTFIAVGVACSVGGMLVSALSNQFALTLGTAEYVVSQLILVLIGAVLGFFIWLCFAATMLTVDQAETV